ncbi:MAG TPA: ornithine carbamoyltransferase [Pirellulaceae bacterium]
MTKRDLLSVFDLTSEEAWGLLRIARDLKRDNERGVREPLLARKMIALLFEKPSLRTRVSFEAAITHLGGNSLYLGKEAGWGGRESIADFTRALSRLVDAIVFRGSGSDVLEELARNSRCPVINGLTHDAHPCQALGDLFTLWERWGSFHDKRLVFMGDSNNVALSLVTLAAMLGLRCCLACPEAYAPDPACQARWRRAFPDTAVEITHDPRTAIQGANAVYTDVWVSMGDEEEREARESDFRDFRVDEKLMRRAAPDAVFMHCLPARRGGEVMDEVMDSPRSIVFDQAENRLHTQKAILLWLLKSPGTP